ETLAQNPGARHFFAFVERGGWFAADRFVAWLKKKLDSGQWRGGQRRFSGMTLARFFAATQVDLSVVASDTSAGRLLVLNHRTAPDCPVVWAVRMSMSIPLVWNEVIWAAEWGAYLGRTLTGHAVVDGGMLSNFPIELFISDEPQVTKVMGPRQDAAVLGLLIDESLPVAPVARRRGILVDVNVKPGELRTVQRITRLIDTMTGAHDKMVIEEFDHLVARLPAAGYGTTEFDMSDERREALVKAGRDAMAAYFDKKPARRAAARGARAVGAKRVKPTADRIAARLLGR
ncbi:MAG: patatin-like phospholipase family protein, partial [Nitrospirota bacterium]